MLIRGREKPLSSDERKYKEIEPLEMKALQQENLPFIFEAFNDYINYIQLVCDFDYKKHLDQFFRKVKEMSDSDSNLPDMIRNVPDNTIAAESVDKKIMEQLDDSDDEKEVINSDEDKDVEEKELLDSEVTEEKPNDSEDEIITNIVDKVVDDAISNVD